MSKAMRNRCVHATLVILVLAVAAPRAWAADTSVGSVDALRQAIDAASPGDVITVQAGTYDVGHKISVNAAGAESAPITVRAETLGEATFRMDTAEGFGVNAPYWHFENLDVVGVCADDTDCEHAFHVGGLSDGLQIKHCRLRDFNAQLKANGTHDGPDGQRVFPDDVVLEDSELFDAQPRQTANPVTKIDVVGGRRWQVRGNYLHDFAKAAGDHISYGAFLKGNSRDGVFAQNLVMCEKLHAGQTRLGLSFGGGGTGTRYCEGGGCPTEHQNGVMRNNIILNCADVGIYLNKASNTKIYNNTVINTLGIDARFGTTDADIRNNLVTGRIKDRNGGSSTRSANIVDDLSTFNQWFDDPEQAGFSSVSGDGLTELVDAGESLAAVEFDYCGRARDDGAHDIGAVEYDNGAACDTTAATYEEPSGDDHDNPDAGMVDGGTADADAGMVDGGQVDADAGEHGTGGPDGGLDAADATIADVGQPSQDGGGSGGDASSAEDGGQPSADAGQPSDDDGCGCASSSGASAPLSAGTLLLMAFALAGVVRRRA